jgi:hypothetical protein
MWKDEIPSAETWLLMPHLTSFDVLVSAICCSCCMSHTVQDNISISSVNANSKLNCIRRNHICTFQNTWLSNSSHVTCSVLPSNTAEQTKRNCHPLRSQLILNPHFVIRMEFCVHGNSCRRAVRTECRRRCLALSVGKWVPLETEGGIMRSCTLRFVVIE